VGALIGAMGVGAGGLVKGVAWLAQRRVRVASVVSLGFGSWVPSIQTTGLRRTWRIG
jgi:hypothetical protein